MEISNWRFLYEVFGAYSYLDVGLGALLVFTLVATAAAATLVVIPNIKLLSKPPPSFGHGLSYTGQFSIIATASLLDIFANAALFAYVTYKIQISHISKARKAALLVRFSFILVLVAASNSLSRHSDADACL